MELLESRLKEMAPGATVPVVFPEYEHIEVLEAAVQLARYYPVEPVLPAEEETVAAIAAGRSLDVEYLSTEPEYAGQDPLQAAAALLERGRARACVVGCCIDPQRIWSDLVSVLPAGECRGPVSGAFLVQVPGSRLGHRGHLVLADGWVNPRPDPEELACIAVDTGRWSRALLGAEPRVALLSFSTLGSGRHELVDRVAQAVEKAREMEPRLALEGELQADAALVEEVGKKKAPDSVVAGGANTLIFPDLQAADTGLRLLVSLAGARSVGPVVQGLRHPLVLVPHRAAPAEIVRAALGAAVLAQA